MSHVRFPAPWSVVAGNNKESPPSPGDSGAATRGDAAWRRGRDLNPRYPFGVHTISSRTPSATRSPLQGTHPEATAWYQIGKVQASAIVAIADFGLRRKQPTPACGHPSGEGTSGEAVGCGPWKEREKRRRRPAPAIPIRNPQSKIRTPKSTGTTNGAQGGKSNREWTRIDTNPARIQTGCRSRRPEARRQNSVRKQKTEARG